MNNHQEKKKEPFSAADFGHTKHFAATLYNTYAVLDNDLRYM